MRRPPRRTTPAAASPCIRPAACTTAAPSYPTTPSPSASSSSTSPSASLRCMPRPGRRKAR
eukprot:6384088-Alexandrium_andersonii.AAC.1